MAIKFLNSVNGSSTLFFNGADDNSGKADFAVKATGSNSGTAISLRSGQFQFGGDDINYEFRMDSYSTTANVRSWNRDIYIRTQSGSTSHHIAFVTADLGTDTEKMRITGDGKVGIGTTSPNQKLHINGNMQMDGGVLYSTASTFTVQNTGGSWMSLNSRGISIGGFGENSNYGDILIGTYDFDILKTGGSSVFKIQNSTGNVGIGTTSPNYKLDVNGDVRIESNHLLRFGGVGSGDEDWFIQRNSLGDLNFAEYAVADGRLYLKAGGNVGIGTTSPSYKLDVNGAAGFNNNPLYDVAALRRDSGRIDVRAEGQNGAQFANYGLFLLNQSHSINLYVSGGMVLGYHQTSPEIRYDNGDLRFRSNAGVERMRLKETGNLGIGTTSPTAKLEVIHTDASLDTLRLGRSDSGSIWRVNHAGGDFRLYNTLGVNNDILLGVDAGGGVHNNKVGIGTASPSYKLHVAGGNIAIDNTYALLMQNSSGNYRPALDSSETGDYLYVGDPSFSRLYFYSNDGYRFYGTGENIYFGEGNTGKRLYFYSTYNQGDYVAHQFNSGGYNIQSSQVPIRIDGSTEVRTMVGGSTKMVVNNTGIGINVTNPTEKLVVNGKTNFYEYSGAHLTNKALSNFQFQTLINNAASTNGSSVGSFIKLTAAVTSNVGFYSDFRSRAYTENTNGNVDWLVNFYAEYRNHTNDEVYNLSNHAGLKVDPLGVGGVATATNNYGIHLDVGTAATNNYGVYQVGSGVDNYFEGNVGIGTLDPSQKLDVAGNLNVTGAIYGGNEIRLGSAQWLRFGTKPTLWADPTTVILRGGSGNDAFKYEDVSGNEKLRITSDGNVGIGTTSPTEKLDVSGNIKVTGDIVSTATSLYDLLPNCSFTHTMTASLVADTWTQVFEGADVLPVSGTYMVQMFINDHSSGGQHYSQHYSGTMSWFVPATNNSGVDGVSEIALHRVGHAANNQTYYLRTEERPSPATASLQIRADISHTADTDIVFKFVRII